MRTRSSSSKVSPSTFSSGLVPPPSLPPNAGPAPAIRVPSTSYTPISRLPSLGRPGRPLASVPTSSKKTWKSSVPVTSASTRNQSSSPGMV